MACFMNWILKSLVLLQVQISKPSETSKGEDTVEEKLKGEDNPEKEVTPFLSGVLLAGILRARTKTPGSQTNELIEVILQCIIFREKKCIWTVDLNMN